MYFYIDGVSYNAEDGVRSVNLAAAGAFEEVVGPVNRGFVARINITSHRGAPASDATKIYISKNYGPFVLKSSGMYGTSYTIDF